MRRILTFSGIPIILALVLLVALGSGGDTGLPRESTGPTPAPTPTPANPPDPNTTDDPVAFETYDDRQRRIGETLPAFGGMFYDKGGVLKVYMLNDTDPNSTEPERVAAARAAIDAEFPSSSANSTAEATAIQLIAADYSVVQLLDWLDALGAAMARAGLLEREALAIVGLDDTQNRLKVRVTDEKYRQEVLDAATAVGMPHAAVNITVGPQVQLLKSVRDRFRPTAGGIKIQDSNRENCTLGFSAVRSGVAGFVTASHCTSIWGGPDDGTVFYQNTKSGSNRVGRETKDGRWGDCPPRYPNHRCRMADVSFIDYDSSIAYDLGHIARTTGLRSRTIDDDNRRFRVVKERDSAARRYVLMYVGQATGMDTVVVSDLCDDVMDGNEVLLCQDFAAGEALHGDSGSPIFRLTNTPKTGDVELYGIMFAYDPDIRKVIYSPMDQIQLSDELGTLQTCAREIGC